MTPWWSIWWVAGTGFAEPWGSIEWFAGAEFAAPWGSIEWVAGDGFAAPWGSIEWVAGDGFAAPWGSIWWVAGAGFAEPWGSIEWVAVALVVWKIGGGETTAWVTKVAWFSAGRLLKINIDFVMLLLTKHTESQHMHFFKVELSKSTWKTTEASFYISRCKLTHWEAEEATVVATWWASASTAAWSAEKFEKNNVNFVYKYIL